MADGPTWSSTTSYSAGERDAGWTTPTHSHGPAVDYAPTTNGHNGHNGHGSSPTNGANGYATNGYAADPRAADQRAVPGRPADGVQSRSESRVASRSATRAEQRAVRQRGLPGWAALLLLVVIAGIGGGIDKISGSDVRGGFNIALVIASLIAILVVRHRDMFPIVVAPPLVYIVASGLSLYLDSGGLHDRKVVIDAAANWLVYGFPAIAGASAAVLIVAGIRLVTNK